MQICGSSGTGAASEAVAVVIGLQELPHPRLRALVEDVAGRALVDDAAVVDEGDAAGDIGGEVLEVMKSLAAEGMTMLIVTHEMGFAAHVADRIAFIDDGRIVDQGPPRHVFHHSKEPRVRQFLQTYHDRNSF